jgi:predicted Zn-dependent protease
MAWQHISRELTVKGFKTFCTSSAVNGIDDMLWNDSAEDGDVRNVKKMKTLTVKMETVTLIGKVR